MSRPHATAAAILRAPGTLTLPGNQPLVTARVTVTDSDSPPSPSTANAVTCRRLDTGHLVIDGPLGRRVLMTDHDGHPLHECEWRAHPDGTARLVSARCYLDWGHWVGLKPCGLVQTTTLDLTTRPGWRDLTRQDLRLMAARAMGVTLDAVTFFYADDDLVMGADGHASIRQRKDALYTLDDGTFDRAHFMSCLGAMRWHTIDYLPVVELFQSLLPGTGGAVFELIRGLYDDQQPHGRRALSYRGIPTYPSEAAFGLFGNFFTASHGGGERPFDVFMDAARSHEVDWLPTPHPPARYVAPHHRLCLTVKHGALRKATAMDDTAGLPFTAPNPAGFAPAGKRATVRAGRLYLADRSTTRDVAVEPAWGITQESAAAEHQPADRSPATNVGDSWEDQFPDGAPAVSPRDAYSAVLLYPDDDTVIGELASQPFVADFWNDLIEHDPSLTARVARAADILIHGFDAALGAMPVGQSHSATVVYTHGAHAQKYAQRLWNTRIKHPPQHTPHTSHRFLPDDAHHHGAYDATYDLICVWLPFALYDDPVTLLTRLRLVSGALRHNGLAWLAGPDSLPSLLAGLPLNVLHGDPVAAGRPFHLHRSILPRAVLSPRLHAWVLTASD